MRALAVERKSSWISRRAVSNSDRRSNHAGGARRGGPDQALKNIEEALSQGDKTKAAGRHNDSANERLFGKRSECAFFQAANLIDQFVKHLALLWIGAAPDAPKLQIAQGCVAQLFRRAPEQDGAANRPGGIEREDDHQADRPRPIIKKGSAGDKQHAQGNDRITDQTGHYLGPFRHEKDLVIGGKFFFGEGRSAMS